MSVTLSRASPYHPPRRESNHVRAFLGLIQDHSPATLRSVSLILDCHPGPVLLK